MISKVSKVFLEFYAEIYFNEVFLYLIFKKKHDIENDFNSLVGVPHIYYRNCGFGSPLQNESTKKKQSAIFGRKLSPNALGALASCFKPLQ